jgi:predicted alpha-1,6-mannanase (GH76 family)
MVRGRLALRVAVITAVAAIVPLAGVTAASAASSASPLQTGMTELAGTYGTGATDLFGTGGFGWQSAVAQSTVAAYEQATGDRRYFSDIAAAYSEYVSSDPRGGFPDFEDNYVDDTGWWGVAWLQAYLLTGNSDYLDVAEADAAYMYDKGWNTDSGVCGGSGGEYWYIPAGTADAPGAIQNELFMELTAWLYNVTKDSTYLTWAEADWSWFDQSKLIGSNYLISNQLNGSPATGCTPSPPTWTYNQGVILGALAQLYVATGTTSYLTEAENIADATINSTASTSSAPALDPGGVLLEPCPSYTSASACNGSGSTLGSQDSFKGIFVQNLKMLATIAGTSQFNSFFQDQATAIEDSDTNSGSQFGMFWDATAPAGCSSITPDDTTAPTTPDAEADINYCNSATQASALDALIAADDQPPVTLGQVEASAGSGYCLDNTGDSSSNGNPIQIWQCNGDAAQQWELIPDSNGIAGDYMLENGNGKCLDDPDDSTTDGTKVQLWTCLGNPNQEWTQAAVGSYVEYVNANGICLDDTGDSHTDSTLVQVWSCSGDTAQQWEGPS